MPSLLLQTAELVKATAEAAGAVTAGAKSEGGAYALLWFLVLVLSGVCFLFYLKAEKATTGLNAAVAEAVKGARADCDKQQGVAKADWAHQQAFDNANWDALLKQSQAREKDALDRLERINAELRQQDKKSVEVIGAVGHSMNNVAATLQGIQMKLATFEMLFTGRPSPPALPPTVFTPPQP